MSFLFHRRQASAPAPVTDSKPGNVVAVLVHKAFVGGTIRRADSTIDSAYSLFNRYKAILPSVDKTNILAFFRKARRLKAALEGHNLSLWMEIRLANDYKSISGLTFKFTKTASRRALRDGVGSPLATDLRVMGGVGVYGYRSRGRNGHDMHMPIPTTPPLQTPYRFRILTKVLFRSHLQLRIQMRKLPPTRSLLK
ncbi:hypothetical protein BC826DRAFT_316723 [Russula brevipes]|nr:hypothetical protein BC826DRAFT_316723 [Russula brevipes]